MSNNIVTVTVAQQVGSTPSTLQRTGAFVSQGGTTLATGSVKLITQTTDLTSIFVQPVLLTAITWLANTVTFTSSVAHGVTVGQTVQATISGVVPTGYNGTFLATATTTTSMTYTLAVNPGVQTVLGNYTPGSVSQLTAMLTTYFAQGLVNSVYVLELGVAGTASGVTSLAAYIANPVVQFYSYLLPTTWDTEPTAPTMAKSFASTTSQVYFYVSSTLTTYTNWAMAKSVYVNLQSPQAPATEFSCAAPFWNSLNYNPSASNMVGPFAYAFVYGVTPYVLTNSQQTTLTAANVNWIGTGAQGQISNTLIQNGVFSDGHVFNYWYGIDWSAINCQIALSAAIINGSNTPQNPLYYNQAGINNLQKVAQNVANTGVSFGVITNPATVFATPFSTYVAANPANYTAGIYNGLSLTIVPTRGFASITINLTAGLVPV